jgi:hypothetical protein
LRCISKTRRLPFQGVQHVLRPQCGLPALSKLPDYFLLGWLCGPCIRRCADRPARDVCAPGLSSLRPESRVCGHAFGVPVSGLMPGAHVALAAEPNAAVNVVARNALAAPDAQLAARTLVTALALCFVACAAPATVGLAARGGHQPLSTGLYTTLQTAVGTPLGHSRRYALISFHYFRRSIATVERREASVPRHKRVHARLDALWDARRLASACTPRHKRVHARL